MAVMQWVVFAVVSVASFPGSSAQFGSFSLDANELPVFSLNQSLAWTLAESAYFTHQVGNDRLVAMTTHGAFSIRQDEGGPKLVNDAYPAAGQYRAGVSWLSDGSTILLTTHLPANQSSDVQFEQQYGVGYYTKRTSTSEFEVAETVTAPFGDWPLLEWAVQIHESSSDNNNQVYYTANVGQRFLQLREGTSSADGFGSNLTSTTKKLSILGYDVFLTLTSPPDTCHCTPQDRCLDDCNPRPTFVLVLTGNVTSYTGSGPRFFGKGGLFAPDMLAHGSLDNDLAADPASNGLSLQFAVGSDASVALLLGYVIESPFDDWDAALTELAATLDAYFKTYPVDSHMPTTSATSWLQSMTWRVNISTLPWADAEVMWHSYNLRAMVTYDDYFQEHILNQAGEYLYNTDHGFQGAARDPLAHAFGFTFSKDETFYRQVLRYTLKEIRMCPAGSTCHTISNGTICLTPDGRDANPPAPRNPIGGSRAACGIPWGIYARGMDFRTRQNMWPSDLQQWVLLSVSQYVLATRDAAFLQETVVVESGQTVTVQEGLDYLYQQFLGLIGFGKHGLCHLMLFDHNDGFLDNVMVPNKTVSETVGESVMNTAMATRVLDKYAQLLTFANASASEVANVTHTRQALIDAMNRFTYNATAGWYRRAWLGPGDDYGWVGDGGVWLEPNAWALLGEVTNAVNSTNAVLASIDTHNRKPSPIGAVFSTDPRIAGLVYSGVWYCGNWVLIMALGHQSQGDQALNEWAKNSLHVHSQEYPEYYTGQWSGPDVYYSIEGKTPGDSPIPYRLHNGWSHTTPLITIQDLVGLDWTANELVLRPSWSEPQFNLSSHRFGLSLASSSTGAVYTGYVRPGARASTETVTVKFQLPKHFVMVITVTVDGKTVVFTPTDDGYVTFPASLAGDTLTEFVITCMWC
eukprot:m.253243 g.253243  ORF g.253243 m.253243 type:complete len:916 (+) comp17534_c0_seq1:866-3613(+)